MMFDLRLEASRFLGPNDYVEIKPVYIILFIFKIWFLSWDRRKYFMHYI